MLETTNELNYDTEIESGIESAEPVDLTAVQQKIIQVLKSYQNNLPIDKKAIVFEPLRQITAGKDPRPGLGKSRQRLETYQNLWINHPHSESLNADLDIIIELQKIIESHLD